MMKPIRIYVVTYRRPRLLERALRSLISQSYTARVAEVLNDDPSDERVLISSLADPRIHLSEPARRRGCTGNFNYAFRRVAEPFASILEDDNWWEPEFLTAMLDALGRHPAIR
jgi:GT2 family glycosyltransferase